MEEIKLKEKIFKLLFKQDCNYSMKFLVSGRSAIDFAIKDLIIKKGITTVLLPDYICESMIEPFKKNRLNIEFYSVKFEDGEFFVDYSALYDRYNTCVLLCDYFVPNQEVYNNIIAIVSENNYVIHDITHTLFSRDINISGDDYIVCSLRKWFDIIDGGLIISRDTFDVSRRGKHREYIEKKSMSKYLKREYHSNPTSERKKMYKYYYNLAEEILNSDFSCYSMSQESMKLILNSDFNKLIKERQLLFQEICRILLDNNIEILKNMEIFNCLFTIPIVVDNRDEVLEKFYDNLIRCAIFWEYNEYNNGRFNAFVDSGICLSISNNTSKQLKKILKK